MIKCEHYFPENDSKICYFYERRNYLLLAVICVPMSMHNNVTVVISLVFPFPSNPTLNWNKISPELLYLSVGLSPAFAKPYCSLSWFGCVHLCVMRMYVNALEQAQQQCSRRLRHAFAPLLQFIISIVTTPFVGVTLLRSRRRWRRLVNLNYTHKRVHIQVDCVLQSRGWIIPARPTAYAV